MPRKPGSPWVIPGARPRTHMTDIDGAWASIRAQAGIHDVRIHDIRHSFASRALALGEGLPIIGRLLGHRRVETTARYAHLARDSVKEPGMNEAATRSWRCTARVPIGRSVRCSVCVHEVAVDRALARRM